MTPKQPINQTPANLSPKPSYHAGQLVIILLVIIVVVVAGGLAIWWITTKPTSTPTPNLKPLTNTNEFKLPPLPDAFYDISGTVKDVQANSFTITARIRTDKDSLSEGYKDEVLTVNYDQTTRFLKRGAYQGNGQIPTLTNTTAKEITPGLAVDVRSRENLRGLTSFTAGEVIIKNSVTTKK